MERNKILWLALLLTRASLVICYLLISGLLVLLAWWMIDPAALSTVELSGTLDTGYSVGDFRFGVPPSEMAEDAIPMNELHPVMAGWLLVRGGIFFAITVTILRKGVDILQSIRSLKTFYADNIAHFQAIARLAFAGFLLGCFNFSLVEGSDPRITLGLALGPLMLSVGSLVLAEIFKEGRQLLEEQDLIV